MRWDAAAVWDYSIELPYWDKQRYDGYIVPGGETMDLIQAMKTYSAVVEAGSFVGAMEATGLSKPAVSRHVAELEEH
ncbi:LysR family transcriptional regulator, partial [Listeria monocytogenes]|uniref:LysR family transcriptional regulator n=1 Tax=Listeria monocytogenes TaxID=1639 RepID=UPI0034D3162B